MAVAPGGEVYVAGFTFVPAGGTSWSPRFLTLKLDPAGQLLWTRTYGYQGFGTGAAYHVAVDGAGDVLVAGQTQNGDYFSVVKYGSDGAELWVVDWPTSAGFVSSPNDLLLTPEGDVLIAGDLSLGLPARAAVVRIDASGGILWARQYDALSGISSIEAMALTAGGEIAVAGSVDTPASGLELSVPLLDAACGVLWSRSTGYPGSVTHDFARDVRVDARGPIVAAGVYGGNTAAGTDGVVLAYDATGNHLWSAAASPTPSASSSRPELEARLRFGRRLLERTPRAAFRA